MLHRSVLPGGLRRPKSASDRRAMLHCDALNLSQMCNVLRKVAAYVKSGEKTVDTRCVDWGPMPLPVAILLFLQGF
jgi:hypothetical protein